MTQVIPTIILFDRQKKPRELSQPGFEGLRELL
jgi:hypothetical protein